MTVISYVINYAYSNIMDFFDQTGKLAIGSRLRMLTDTVTADAASIYKMFGMDFKPKWFPVFFVLSHGRAMAITSIAREIGHSHPSVSRIIKEMLLKGLVEEARDESDGRRNMVMLTESGKKMSASFREQCVDVTAAIERIAHQTRNDLWDAIGEWEALLSERSLLQRVKDEKRARERKEVTIVPYESCYQPVFKSLTEEWIKAHWQMEEADYKAVDHPQEYILDKGGFIFVALCKGVPVGVCALCKLDDPIYDYELSKLAVSPGVQGRGIGELLCKTVIEKARELGCKKIFLESNTLLEPAIHLYRKLGFRKILHSPMSYHRADIKMELLLTD